MGLECATFDAYQLSSCACLILSRLSGYTTGVAMNGGPPV
jgi:hypothetical protein